MTGKKGRSGGKRPGAGAPVRTWVLRTGDVVRIGDRLAHVRIISRGEAVLIQEGTNLATAITREEAS